MFYFHEMQRNFTELYGPPTSTYPEQLEASDSYTRLFWEGDKAIISLRWLNDFPQLTITSVPLRNEIKDDISFVHIINNLIGVVYNLKQIFS